MNVPDRFHAHIYFDQQSKEAALDLRHRIERQFELELGRVHDKPVGPHPIGMYQVKFSGDQFSDFVRWLMVNRENLDVLVHADTGDDLADHTNHALWLGHTLALNLEVFS